MFLKRTSAGSNTADGDYGVINSSAGSSAAVGASELIARDVNGDFGGRTADLQSIKIDNNLAIDTLAGGSGGYIRYYGFNSVGGILVQSDTAVAANNKIAYWNDSHEFKNKTGGSNAPITAVGAITSNGAISTTSTVTCTGVDVGNNGTLTTGGATNLGNVTGYWSLTGSSRFQATYAADLAENYEGDEQYEVGTVLVFGGESRIS